MERGTKRAWVWYELSRWSIALPLFGLLRVRYFGRENIPPAGGLLMVSNHQSHFDPPVLGIGSPRQTDFVARRTLFDIPIIGRWMSSVGVIPLDREGIGLAGIKESLKRLKQGRVIVIFPEGTRTHDGRIGPFKPGFTTLAVRTRSAILPAALEGTYDAFRRGQKLPRRATICVQYGKPIMPDEIARMGEQQLIDEVERRVHGCLRQLHEHPSLRGLKRLRIDAAAPPS